MIYAPVGGHVAKEVKKTNTWGIDYLENLSSKWSKEKRREQTKDSSRPAEVWQSETKNEGIMVDIGGKGNALFDFYPFILFTGVLIIVFKLLID